MFLKPGWHGTRSLMLGKFVKLWVCDNLKGKFKGGRLADRNCGLPGLRKDPHIFRELTFEPRCLRFEMPQKVKVIVL